MMTFLWIGAIYGFLVGFGALAGFIFDSLRGH